MKRIVGLLCAAIGLSIQATGAADAKPRLHDRLLKAQDAIDILFQDDRGKQEAAELKDRMNRFVYWTDWSNDWANWAKY